MNTHTTSGIDRWNRIKSILTQVLEAAPADRDLLLDRLCGSDEDLAAEVAALVAADAEGAAILDGSAADLGLRMTNEGFETPAAEDPGSIGPYRVIREVGRGGMATVYACTRDDGSDDDLVALKLLRPGFGSADQYERFLAEQEILEVLHHPGIARMFESGIEPTGRPYLVMELVDGLPITEYCDARRHSLRKRLELFRAVCSAVDYAHRNLIVHRDLKPSNILVTGDGEVKLLDFGIAKLLEPGSGGNRHPITRTGFRVMTPEYASPEQVRGEPIGTASDVYQLGQLLYELVAGVRPHPTSGSSLLDLERIVSREPAAPSRRVSDIAHDKDGKVLEEICASRSITPSALQKMLRGDIDAVVLQAMHPEVEQRYRSASDLAADVANHLEGRPVSARPNTLRYRASRMVRRNPRAVTAAVSFSALLVALVVLSVRHSIVTTNLSHAIAEERDNAMGESEKATALADYLATTLESFAPHALRSGGDEAAEFLTQQVANIERRFADRPEIKTRLWDVMGRVYQSYGAYEQAEELLSRSLAERRRFFGEPHEQVARSLEHLAWLLQVRGEYEDALALYGQAQDQYDRLFEGDHPQKAEVLDGMAAALLTLGDYGRSEGLMRASAAMRDRLYEPSHPARAKNMASMGYLLMQTGRLDEAEDLLVESLAIRKRALGDHHDEVSVSLQSLGQLYEMKGDVEAAESLYVESLAVRRHLFGDDHPRIAQMLGHLGWLRMQRGQLDEAEEALVEASAIWQRAFGDDHISVAHGLKMMGTLRLHQGRLAEADELLSRARSRYVALFGAGHRSVTRTQEVIDDVQRQMTLATALKPAATQ